MDTSPILLFIGYIGKFLTFVIKKILPQSLSKKHSIGK